MIELWHEWNSVHSFKVRIVLAEKRLAWTDRRVELLRFEHLMPDYLAVNPDGVVPTLVHDGRRLYDSSPICEYLEDAFPVPSLRPAEPHARLEARRWLKFHDDVAHHAVRDASFQLLFKPGLAAMPRAQLEALVARHPNPDRRRKFLDGASQDIDQGALLRAWQQCVGIAARVARGLDGHPWLGGASFGLADVAMAPFVERVVNLRFEQVWRPHPEAAAWADRLMARESVDSSRPPPQFRLPRPDAALLRPLAAAVAAATSAS